MLQTLAEVGCRVTFFGSATLSNTPWPSPESRAFSQRYRIATELHRFTPFDRWIGRAAKRLYRPVWSQRPVSPRLPAPAGMGRRFAQTVRRSRPDVIWMNYVCWDGLLDGLGDAAGRRVIDTHDLVTANMQMQRLLGAELARLRRSPDLAPGSRALCEDYFDRMGLRPCPAEFEILDRYDATIAISPRDAAVIRRNTNRTQVWTVPMCEEPVSTVNTHADPPVMLLGTHVFNLQGLLYFGHRVMPRILERCPAFACRVTGGLCADPLFPRAANLVGLGFVRDLRPLLGGAAFAICPVFGGTGQPVKITEAMAHGLPVVTTRAAAEVSPLRHGVSGLVAADAAEFAEHCLRLWGDRGLCRRMGEAAREAIASECSPERLCHTVVELLSVV